MKLYLSFISLIFVLVSPVLAEPVLTINTAASSPYTKPDMTGLADRIISEAFRRTGYEIKIVSLPSERALINANAGIEDGNFIRVAGLNKLYPNLIMVPEKITAHEFVVFTKSAFFEIVGWKSLQPYMFLIT